MTRMVVATVVLALAGGCTRTKTAPAEAPSAAPEPTGLYGRLEAGPGATLRVFRAGVQEPVATVALDQPLSLPLARGVYVAVLEDDARRVFAVTEDPVRISGGIDDVWPGEDLTVQRLGAVHRRWFQWAREGAEDSQTLRAKALAEVVTDDPRLRALEVLAAEGVFAEPDTPPPSTLLEQLPAPDDPALALTHEFAGPVYLIAKYGGDAEYDRAQAWLDAMARTNPEPGARVVALYYALETARLRDSAEGIAERYAWLPELGLERASMFVELIESEFAPDRLARPGAPLPDFSLVALDDPTQHFGRAALEGDLVLLHFWATWCRPCQEHIPELQRVHEALAAEGRPVRFVSINLDDDPEDGQRYLQAHPMPWTHLHGGAREHSEVLATFGLLGPSMLLVDRDRRIIATAESLHDTLESTLRDALAATP